MTHRKNKQTSKQIIKYTSVFKGAGGGGGPRPKRFFYIIVVEGKQSYQMLLTGSKNIDPSRI